MIQIDDSGWGSLLGGVMIGVYNTETGQLYARLVPVSFFQRRKFEKKDYLAKALSIAESGVQMFTNNLTDTGVHIQVCRGYFLSTIREWLEENKEKFARIEHADIKDPLQSALEDRFSQSLGRIGVPDNGSGGAHRISFNAMLKWIKEDPKRIKYAKTGWKSWDQKYSKEVL